MQVYSHLLPRAQTLAACGDPQGQPRAVEENSWAHSEPVDRLCSSCPWRHIILTSYSVPQTSHWCWNLYSDLGGRTWAVKFWAWRGTSLYCYLYHFEHLENARTNPVKDTYPFFLLSIIKAFPIWGLDLTHNSSKPTDKWRNVQQWCGTGRNRCMGQEKKMGQGEHI